MSLCVYLCITIFLYGIWVLFDGSTFRFLFATWVGSIIAHVCFRSIYISYERSRMSHEVSMDPLKYFPYPSVSICLSSALGETSSLQRRWKCQRLDYTVPIVGNLRRTLVWSILRQQNGSVAGTCVKRELVGRMMSSIHRSRIDQWWERNCNSFIWKEVELRRKSLENTHEAIFYSERSSD